MPRHCPDCGAQMEDDSLHCWCPAAGCTFKGYVILQTGKILRDQEPEDDDDDWQDNPGRVPDYH